MSTGIWLKGMRRVRLGKKPLFVEIYYMHHFHCLCLPMHGRIKLYNNGSPYPMESGGFSAGRRQGKALKPDGDTGAGGCRHLSLHSSVARGCGQECGKVCAGECMHAGWAAVSGRQDAWFFPRSGTHGCLSLILETWLNGRGWISGTGH